MTDKLSWMCTIEGCDSPREGNTVCCARHGAEARKIFRESLRPKKQPSYLQRGGAPKRISPTNLSYGSDGTAYTGAEIASNRKRCYEHLDFATKSPYCEAHGPNCSEWMLDHDHTIAQSRCKQIGKTELIWDEGNIEFSCRIAHKQWESYKSGEFAKHKNFTVRMEYFKRHDYEGWVKRAEVAELMNRPKETV